jgi:3-oxoadipate CoA-transferase alpha subunit
MPIDKIVSDVDAALDGIGDGDTIMVGGFGGAGAPTHLLDALAQRGLSDLTVVANNAGSGTEGLAGLLRAGSVRRIVCSYPRMPGSVVFDELYAAGSIELELVPQGTLSERIRAGGAGIAAFYTPTAVGTDLALGREVRSFDGRDHLLELALVADHALIRARRADRHGNLVYDKVGRNFGPTMAMAATNTVAEVDEVVELGALDPECIVTPGVFVQRVLEVGDR